MIKLFIPVLALIFPLSLLAQQKIESGDAKLHPVSIRVNLFGPLDVLDGNLTGGIEYAIAPRLSLTADIGAIFYSVYIANNSRALGYSFKPGVRYYLTERRRGYIEGDVFYKRVGYKISDWLQRGNTNGVPAYEENRTFIYRKRVMGFQFISGYKAKINKKATAWLEPYGGFSVRLRWQDVKGLPDAVYRDNSTFFGGDRQTYAILPGIQIGMKLVFDLAVD